LANGLTVDVALSQRKANICSIDVPLRSIGECPLLAIEQLVGHAIDRLHADAGYRGHNASPD
jgi:hypothetical protein